MPRRERIAAPFIDRIAHHALITLMEPWLEQALVPTSYACRPGRGVHAASLHAQALMRRWPAAWTLKLDVEHCFRNIDHKRLLALLRRRFKGSVMGLVENIARGHTSAPGSGLPIGAFTSQHFANQFLGELDREALAQPLCRAHLRYMDDVVLWCDSLQAARELHRHLAAFASHKLLLALKPPAIQRCDRGLALCGMRLGPRGIRLGQRRQRACDTLRAPAVPAQAARWQSSVLARWPIPGHEPDAGARL